MEKTTINVLLILLMCTFWSCKEQANSSEDVVFNLGPHLDSLKNGSLDYGSPEVNESAIRLLNFQKKFKTGEKVGTVIPKSLITQAVNGFTGADINLPIDTSNFNKWDFMVIYPGISINEQGEEKAESSVFFYKGALDGSGKFLPVGKPILDIKFRGGGGGPGDAVLVVPPPRTP
jgi:hypothetical protein